MQISMLNSCIFAKRPIFPRIVAVGLVSPAPRRGGRLIRRVVGSGCPSEHDGGVAGRDKGYRATRGGEHLDAVDARLGPELESVSPAATGGHLRAYR